MTKEEYEYLQNKFSKKMKEKSILIARIGIMAIKKVFWWQNQSCTN